MTKPVKKPHEIPAAPEKPEVKPPEEVPTKTWPVKTPEIIPVKIPERIAPPYEVPAPLEE